MQSRSVLLVVLSAGALVVACSSHGGESPAPFPGRASGAPSTSASDQFAVPPPPFSEGIFPCSDCHKDMKPDPTRREIPDHKNIVLDHGDRDRWCFDCHNPDDRDKLRLASGKLVPFSESYRLCGQCHGDKYRDWRLGVHGKRTGLWNGKKQYLLCAHCHNPHSPHFKPLAPEPMPKRPRDIR